MNNESSWGDRHDTRVDRAIDRAVREMVQVDPALGLRRRVLSRLEAPQHGSRVLRYAWGTAILALAAVVLMLGRDRPTELVTAGPNPAEVSAVPAPSSDRTTDVPSITPTSTPSVPRRGASSGVTREAIPMPRVANVFGSPSPAVSAAAASNSESVRPASEDVSLNSPAAVPPLVIAPLMPAPIETPAIVIEPLVMAAPKGGR
jgi:hypothetical protein